MIINHESLRQYLPYFFINNNSTKMIFSRKKMVNAATFTGEKMAISTMTTSNKIQALILTS